MVSKKPQPTISAIASSAYSGARTTAGSRLPSVAIKRLLGIMTTAVQAVSASPRCSETPAAMMGQSPSACVSTMLS